MHLNGPSRAAVLPPSCPGVLGQAQSAALAPATALPSQTSLHTRTRCESETSCTLYLASLSCSQRHTDFSCSPATKFCMLANLMTIIAQCISNARNVCLNTECISHVRPVRLNRWHWRVTSALCACRSWVTARQSACSAPAKRHLVEAHLPITPPHRGRPHAKDAAQLLQRCLHLRRSLAWLSSRLWQ
jgi:hypothetical protein